MPIASYFIVKLPTCDQARIYYEKNKLYSVLGVDPKATEDVIKRHFRKMSILCMLYELVNLRGEYQP